LKTKLQSLFITAPANAIRILIWFPYAPLALISPPTIDEIAY